MDRKRNFLLVTDSSHPEIFAIANQLSSKNIPFTLVSSFVFTRNEFHILTRLPFLPDALKLQIDRRSVDISRDLTSVIRTIPLVDLLAKSLNRLPNRVRGRWWIYVIAGLDNRLKRAFGSRASKILRESQFSHLVYQSSLEIEVTDDSIIPIEIAYHGNLSQEIFWRNIAAAQYPDWKDTWKISGVPNLISQDSTLQIALPSKIVYASSFNALYSENSIESIYSPLGAIKTGELEAEMKSKVTSLIHIGQLSLRKGIPIILDVAKKVPANFTLCGSGSAEVILKIKNAKSPNLELLLTPSDADIRAKLTSSQAFMLPSYYEGFGIAILEAMSYGCIPIVSRNTCGPDILRGTELERFLIPPGNVSALEEAIMHLIEMEDSEKLYLGEIAATISKQFTLSAYGERVLDSLLA
jgi:glycosyltransferase involved in cell wall biosynthesis